MIKKLLLTSLLVATGSANAAESAKSIMDKVSSQKKSDYFKGTMTMSLINSSNSERVRKIQTYSSSKNDVVKTVSFFKSPQSVAGTAFLSVKDEKKNESSRWVYMPSLKKLKELVHLKVVKALWALILLMPIWMVLIMTIILSNLLNL